jgi:uncharacterized protein
MEISGNGLKQDSYLFGTIHMLCPDDFEIKQKCLDALNASQKVVFEVDLSKPENLQVVRAFAAPEPRRWIEKRLSDNRYLSTFCIILNEDIFLS